MPGFSLLTDAIIAVGAYAVFVAFTLRWVHFTGQSHIPKTAATTRLVTTRLAIVVALCFSVCWLADVALWVPILALVALLLLALGGDILGLPGIVLFWLIQQYVLGFPAREDIFLEAPEPINSDQSQPGALTQFIGKRGKTFSALKPAGEIVLGDSRHNAASESGAYVAANEIVVVTGVKNGVLVVGCPDSETER